MKNTFFYVCPILLENGSIISPGNFGRVIQEYQEYRPSDLGHLAVRELTFEIVRSEHFSDKPSRLTSLFLFSTKEAAFENIVNFSIGSVIYEVELIEEGSKIFKGDMDLIAANSPNEKIPAIPFIMQAAASYWNGQNLIPEKTEVLTDSPVRILRLIDPRVKVPKVSEPIGFPG
ncbi:MAG: DUF2441 domain-containing protein [Desulfobacter sp.]